MRLQQFKDWINTLEEKYLEYECVYSVYKDNEENEEGKWTRTDTLITSCFIDEGHSECSFSSNRPEELCSSPKK